MSPIIIGLCGPSGSGKSKITKELEALLDCKTFSADSYFKFNELPTMISPDDGNEYPDWNSPLSIDYDRLYNDIVDAVKQTEHRYIIVEGSLIYSVEKIRQLCNIKLFVTATKETCIYRRIVRNITLMGQTPEFIGGYYLKCARHREAEYCLPYVKCADMVIDNDVDYRKDMQKCIDFIKSY